MKQTELIDTINKQIEMLKEKIASTEPQRMTERRLAPNDGYPNYVTEVEREVMASLKSEYVKQLNALEYGRDAVCKEFNIEQSEASKMDQVQVDPYKYIGMPFNAIVGYLDKRGYKKGVTIRNPHTKHTFVTFTNTKRMADRFIIVEHDWQDADSCGISKIGNVVGVEIKGII